MNKPARPSSDNRSPWRYLGLATQIMVYLVLAVWVGYRLDKFLGIFPVLTALFPLLILVILFYKLIRETRK